MTLKGLLVAEYFPPVTGGAARRLEVIVDNARSLEWSVVTQPVDGAPAHETRGRHEVTRLEWWSTPEPSSKVRTTAVYARLFWWLLRLTKKNRPDVIHAMPVCGAALPALLVARLRRIPVVTHVFGEEFTMRQGRSPAIRAIMNYVLSRSDAVICDSSRTKGLAVEFGAAAEKVHLMVTIKASFVPTPTDQARRALGIAASPILVTVGRLAERKGHDMVIRAIPDLKKKFPDLKYYIAGEGDWLPVLKNLAKELNVENDVVFLGLVAEEKLPLVYSAADLFVMPNRELSSGEMEGLGLVFLEAASCGKASIGGRSGGTDYAIIEGVTGLLVDPLDSAELASSIAGLLGDRSRLDEMGREALDYARRTCSLERVLDVVETIP